METRKKRNRALSVVIAASLGLLIMGILTYRKRTGKWIRR